MKEQKNAIIVTDAEVKAAQEEMSRGKFEHNFKTPVEWEGKTYASLHFDLDTLTGGDSLAIERELTAQGIRPFARSLDLNYQIRVAVRACDEPVGVDFFEIIPLRDFDKIMNRVQSFLLRAE